MPESILPEVSPASIPAPWPHPVAWTIRLYTASGDVAAELVRTPHQPFILHGDADDRVPISQGYEFYNALKRQGVEVQMVVYPRTPHGPQEPKFLADLMQRHLDWVNSHLPPAPR